MLDQLRVTPAMLKQASALLKTRAREKVAFTPMDANGPGGGAPPGDPSQGGGAPPPGGPGGPGSPPPPGGDPAAAAGGQPVTADMLQQILPQMIQQIMMQMGGGMPGGAPGGGGGGGKGSGKTDQMAMIQHDIGEIKNQINQLFAFLTGMKMQDPDGQGAGGAGGAPPGMGAGVDPSQGPGDAATMPGDPAGGGGAPPPPQGGGPGMQVSAALREVFPAAKPVEKQATVANGKAIAATIARLQRQG